MARYEEDRFLKPGRLYRDLDGSLVHLVSVDHDLCSWVAISDSGKKRHVTHRENFRRRFRAFDKDAVETKAAA